ncbi:MAG: hypothetical protein JNN15_04965 [Blastocatellia bacterium]|nr:hypothetical protein [Blastocatellia bacterium]
MSSILPKLQRAILSIKSFRLSGRGYLRPVELIAILIFLGSASFTLYLYFHGLTSRNHQIETLDAESKKLKEDIEKIKKQRNQDLQLVEATSSVVEKLEGFEQKFLKRPQEGRLKIVDEINNLVRKNNLALPSGLTFSKIEDIKTKEQNDLQLSKAKVRRSKDSEVAIYPGIGVKFTVAGNYASLRRFIYDLENSNTFFVIRSIDIGTEKAEDGRGQRTAAGGAVSLDITLRTYFQRPNVVQNSVK